MLRDTLPSDEGGLHLRLVSILGDVDHGRAISDDVRAGFSALPEWMQRCRDLLKEAESAQRRAQLDFCG